MCGGQRDSEDNGTDIDNVKLQENLPIGMTIMDFDTLTPSSLSGGRRRPLGSRRRQLEWLTNFVLLVVSVFGVMVGAGLLGFYKIHLLRFLSVEFFILPLVLLGGGLFTLLVSIIGLVATSQRSPCLLRFYAFMLLVAFLVLLGSITCSVKVIFKITSNDEFESDEMEEITTAFAKNYHPKNVTFATKTWDSLHQTYRCCGAEIGDHDLGYLIWDHHENLEENAVPRSCCIRDKLNLDDEECGHDIFRSNLRNIKGSEYIRNIASKIYLNGCITTIKIILEDQITPLLIAYAATGSVLSFFELLGVVLACNLATIMKEQNDEKKRITKITQLKDVASTSSRRGSRRPSSNVMMMEREQVAALEQHEQLLKQSTEGGNNGSSIAPPSPKMSTYSSTLTPSSTLNSRIGLDQRKYSSGFDTRKYSSQVDPYRKYSSVSGYGTGRSYLSPNSGYASSGTGPAFAGATNQQVPMIDDK